MAQDVFSADLVVKHVEAKGGLRLSPAIEPSLKGLDLLRRCPAHRQSPSPHHRQKRTRSQGPLLRRHYTASALLRPCPTLAATATCCDVEAATLVINESRPSCSLATGPIDNFPGRWFAPSGRTANSRHFERAAKAHTRHSEMHMWFATMPVS